MFITGSLQPYNFPTIEDELKYWKTSYSKLYGKYKTLSEDYKQLLSCLTCKTAVPENFHPPSPKKRKIEEIRLDPIECLPEPCAVEILKYLTVPELKLAMEVSKGWRKFINGKNSLMGKMRLNTTWNKNKTFVRWDREESNLRFEIFNERNERNYKHLKTSFDFNSPFHGKNPVSLYASTLETLEIDIDLEEKYQRPRSYFGDAIFPNLRDLVLPHCFKFFRLIRCDFPVLTHLRISYEALCYKTVDCAKLLELIYKMPKLEVLSLCIPKGEPSKDPCDIGEDESNLTNDNYKPAIKSILSSGFFPTNFIKKLQSPLLTEMKFADSDGFKLAQFLRNFNTFKYLTIKYLCIYKGVIIQANNLVPNESIEVFKVFRVLNYNSAEADVDAGIETLLRALPSLKELALYDHVTPRILEFVAGNMRHLKKLICKEVSPELMRVYRKIQIYQHLYVNTSFELIAEPSNEASFFSPPLIKF